MKFKSGDMVFVKPPIPGLSEGATGMIADISIEEDITQYLVHFGGGSGDWYPESLIKAHEGPIRVPKNVVKKSQWDYNIQLKELILDIVYELSPNTFDEAFDICYGSGSAMLDWLEITNPDLYKNARLKGFARQGIKVYYANK